MKIAPAIISLTLALATTLHAEPKKLLVVSTTTGFRHSSIPTGEKVLGQLAQSSGAFTVDFVHQPEGMPKNNNAPAKGSPAEAALQEALLKLSPDSLKNYDGVIFLSTTGDLPIPDKAGFLAWIKGGGAFIGIHAATDTFHGWPGYLEMIGGEFLKHGAQLSVECLNVDPLHPANWTLGKSFNIAQEEVYQFKTFDQGEVHELLVLDKHPEADRTPGHFSVSWCKNYGKGKVFYTSLGHREDIWDTDPSIKDRKNTVEVSQAFQAHLLGGIKWALGLESSKAVNQQ